MVIWRYFVFDSKETTLNKMIRSFVVLLVCWWGPRSPSFIHLIQQHWRASSSFITSHPKHIWWRRKDNSILMLRWRFLYLFNPPSTPEMDECTCASIHNQCLVLLLLLRFSLLTRTRFDRFFHSTIQPTNNKVHKLVFIHFIPILGIFGFGLHSKTKTLCSFPYHTRNKFLSFQ